MIGYRAGETAFPVPKQFAGNDLPLLVLRAVHLRKRFSIPIREEVEGARDQLLARPCFAGNQHRAVRPRELHQTIEHVDEAVVPADDLDRGRGTPPLEGKLVNGSGHLRHVVR